MGRRSVATIDSPEFLNITSISPKISKCEIKVMYVGQNRNRSCITKEVATQMAETLRGVPIVGYWCESKEDFLDHGEQIVIDGEGVKFKDMTKPYGFVAPDSKIWFQKFEETDDFGNTVTREYLMTEGYLWTEQYEECKRVIEEGNPQSMKLDSKNLKGFWSTDNNKGIDFFIINDAMFENLCILGEEVEPCFEGADITAPKLSSNFNMNEDMVTTMFSMIKELKEVIISFNEGGSQNMDGNTNVSVEESVGVQVEENALATAEIEDTETNFTAENQEETIVEEEVSEEFAKEDKKEEKEDSKGSEDVEEKEIEDSPVKEDGTDKEEEKKKKFELLENEFAALQEKYDSLEAQYNELVEFKAQIENEKKDALISSFYMLSDEDKADVIQNKANYSLEEIEAKLSVICVRKKVNFDLDTDNENESKIEANATTFNLNSLEEGDSAPAWVTAMRNIKNNK